MRKLMIAFAVFGLTACANAPEQEGQAITGQPATAIISLPKSGLGPQVLAPGECGLFLWSQTDINTFIFFLLRSSFTQAHLISIIPRIFDIWR